MVGLAYRLRIMGSLAISLCHLAAGRVDGVCSLKPARSVDIAAGQLLVRECGLAIDCSRRRRSGPRPSTSSAARAWSRRAAERALRGGSPRRSRRGSAAPAGTTAHWRERFYPPGLPRGTGSALRPFFDTVEVNTTFYRLPSARRWRAGSQESPPGFCFAVKVSRYVTHVKRLRDLGPGSSRFYERIAPLVALAEARARAVAAAADSSAGTTTGSPARSSALPPGRHAFEFRHPSWFAREVYEAAAGARRRARRRRPTRGGRSRRSS